MSDIVLRAQDRLPGAERLDAIGRHPIGRRHLVKFLKCVGHVHDLFDPLADRLAEVVLDRMLDDDDRPVEPGKACVVQCIIDDGLAVRTE